MDLDRDGRVDVLSGSYAPGEIYLFPGGEHGFGAPRVLTDVKGVPLRVGRAAWPFACDWDRDGDLDLVIGNMFGQVFLARNTSGGKALAFAPAAPLVVTGAPLETVQTNACPCVADWDGDGSPDLLLGTGDGSVILYRNVKKEGEPGLAAPAVLVPASPEGNDPARLSRPGIRARVAVTDWNEDGRLDLVVGEYAGEDGPLPQLTEAQQKELDATIQQSLQLATRRGQAEQAALPRWLAAKKIPPEQAGEHFDEFQADWVASDEGREIVARQTELAAIQRRLNPALIEHGRVWVFLRKPKEEKK